MHPLQELFDLYENDMNVMAKPELRNSAGDFAMGTPGTHNSNVFQHPVIQARAEVDELRNQGVPIEIAHQQVHGRMDMANIQDKADMAATMGRIQDDGTRKGLKLSAIYRTIGSSQYFNPFGGEPAWNRPKPTNSSDHKNGLIILIIQA